MNFWNKSKTQSDNQTSPATTRPEDFEKKLEQIHFQARPDFREDLKDRLMQNLAEQKQPKAVAGKGSLIPGLTHSRRFPAQARLALGGLGLAALALILISILSVGVVYRNPTVSASVAAGASGPVKTTPGTSTTPATPSSLESASNLTALKAFFDPITAAKTVGFTVNIPAFLPAGYKLNYAAVNTPLPGPAGNTTATLSLAGYILRYGDTAATTVVSPTSIEITQWQVPFNVDTTGPTTASMSATGTGVNTATNQSPQSITISGAPAFIIQGGQWQVQLAVHTVTATVIGPGIAAEPGRPGTLPGPVALDPVSGSITSTSVISEPISATNVISGGIPITATGVISGAVAVPAGSEASLTAAGPLITFTEVGSIAITDTQGQTSTAGSAGVVVGFNTQDSQVKTLVWQQGSLFTVLTAPVTLSDTEIKQIAESLKPAE